MHSASTKHSLHKDESESDLLLVYRNVGKRRTGLKISQGCDQQNPEGRKLEQQKIFKSF